MSIQIKMDSHSNRISDEEIEKLNVRCVVGALASLKTEATEDEIIECFSTSSEPQIDVQDEIKRVLDHGVTCGLIVRNANKYALPTREDEFQTDGDDGDDDYYDDDDIGDASLKLIEPRISKYLIYDTPRVSSGRGYRRLTATPKLRKLPLPHPPPQPTPQLPPPPPPPKRKYTRKEPEPTDRRTRSQTRAARSARGSPSPARKRVKPEAQPRTRYSSGSKTKTGRKGGRARGGR